MRIFQPQFGSGTADVRRGAFRAKNVILQGNQPSIGEIFDLKIQYGRFYNQTDAEHRAPVVLLGYDTTRILFPESPERSLGQEVVIDGQLFTVIGALQKQKQGISGGANPEDNSAYMPVTTLRKLYPNQKDYVIFAKARDPNNVVFLIGIEFAQRGHGHVCGNSIPIRKTTSSSPRPEIRITSARPSKRSAISCGANAAFRTTSPMTSRSSHRTIFSICGTRSAG